ncbi:MAG TPA: G/U mismatch-specific DNA glycosylase [Anaerolineaceae bacterium]
MSLPPPPTPAEIRVAEGKTVADVIAPGLKVLFCGINPGLYTAAIGHHFGRPGNRFWPALYAAGITPRLLTPYEERELLTYGYGITNVVARATARADALTRAEYAAGGKMLEGRVRQYQPGILAVLGVGAYRAAFDRPKAVTGPQDEMIGATRLWILPNPSGLNAHYDLAGLARLFAELKAAAE